MEDFVNIIVKNFTQAQNRQNWEDMKSFMFFGVFVFFPFTCIMVTNSLIIVGAHLMKNNQKKKKKQRVLGAIPFLD